MTRSTLGLENLSITHSRLEVDLAPPLEEVKIGLRHVFRKKRDIIIRLGEELLKRINRPDEICGSIKHMLRNEISENVITDRAIELFCPREWKRRTKPLKNEMISFSGSKIPATGAIPAVKTLNTNYPESCQQKICDGTTQNANTTDTPMQRPIIFFEASAIPGDLDRALSVLDHATFFERKVFIYGQIDLRTNKVKIGISGKCTNGHFIELSSIEGIIVDKTLHR
jgi:hypothetical protein